MHTCIHAHNGVMREMGSNQRWALHGLCSSWQDHELCSSPKHGTAHHRDHLTHPMINLNPYIHHQRRIHSLKSDTSPTSGPLKGRHRMLLWFIYQIWTEAFKNHPPPHKCHASSRPHWAGHSTLRVGVVVLTCMWEILFHLPNCYCYWSDLHHMGVNQKNILHPLTIKLRTLEIYGHEHSKRVLLCP